MLEAFLQLPHVSLRLSSVHKSISCNDVSMQGRSGPPGEHNHGGGGGFQGVRN